MHHITLRVDELDASVAHGEAKSGKLLPVGSFRDGEYACIDMTQQLQVILELLAQ